MRRENSLPDGGMKCYRLHTSPTRKREIEKHRLRVERVWYSHGQSGTITGTFCVVVTSTGTQ
jgi:hypothetical protein